MVLVFRTKLYTVIYSELENKENVIEEILSNCPDSQSSCKTVVLEIKSPFVTFRCVLDVTEESLAIHARIWPNNPENMFYQAEHTWFLI